MALIMLINPGGFMKKIFILLLFLVYTSIHAKQEMLPGHWKITFKIKTADQVIDPAKKIKDSLSKMNKQERAELKKLLKNEAGMDEDGKISICYTPESFNLEEATITQISEHCVSKVMKSTPKKVVTHFICDNGIKGTNTWNIKNSRNYSGTTKVMAPWGEESEIIYEGNYFAPVCEIIDEIVI